MLGKILIILGKFWEKKQNGGFSFQYLAKHTYTENVGEHSSFLNLCTRRYHVIKLKIYLRKNDKKKEIWTKKSVKTKMSDRCNPYNPWISKMLGVHRIRHGRYFRYIYPPPKLKEFFLKFQISKTQRKNFLKILPDFCNVYPDLWKFFN